MIGRQEGGPLWAKTRQSHNYPKVLDGILQKVERIIAQPPQTRHPVQLGLFD